MTFAYRSVSFAALVAGLLLSGCSMGDLNSPAPTPTTLPHISGVVHGGQSPIGGATIQLYETNTTTNQGASTAILTTTVTTATDGSGSFSISGDYTCPASNPLVYLVSTGGNPGLSGTVNNTNIALMALLGTCSSLTSSTYVVINELTTVAAVEALSSFMTDYAHVGEAPTNPAAMAAAFAQANGTVGIGTGTFGGSSLDVPRLQISTLGNILAACVNTAGSSTSGDGSMCGTLLSLTGTTTDTVAAALAMVQSPGHNVSSLYGLISATPPFQPYFTSVPTDFTSSVGFTYPANIKAAALDSKGQIWVYTGGYTYNTVTNTSTDVEGVLTVYDNNFNQLFTISPGTGGLYYPTTLTPDASGNVYATNANNTVSAFSSSGSTAVVLSSSGGWTTGATSAFTGTETNVGYATNSDQVGPIRPDSDGNLWGKTTFGTSTACYVEMNASTGAVTTPSAAAAGNFCSTMSGISDFGETDGSGNSWGQSFTAIEEVNSSGTRAAAAPPTAGCFYPSADATGSTADEITDHLAYDHVNNQLWGISETGAGTITDSGSNVFCDQGATTLPVIPVYTNTNTTQGQPYTAGSLVIISSVLDGAGNLWFSTGGVAVNGTVGTSSSLVTGTVTYSTWLGEISPTGKVLSPFNPTSGVYGYQPVGFGVNASATVNNASVTTASATASLLGVDVNGNIWALDLETSRVLKITGMATANTVNY